MPALTSFALGTVIAGSAISTIGKLKANHAEAAAERANADFLDEQAEFARQATARELDIFNNEAEMLYGKQITQAGRGGVELTGSALSVLADTKLKQISEGNAIQEDGRMKVREAVLKAGASRARAESLTSKWTTSGEVASGSAQIVSSYIGMKK